MEYLDQAANQKAKNKEISPSLPDSPDMTDKVLNDALKCLLLAD